MQEKIDVVLNKSKIYFTPLFNSELIIRHHNRLKNTYFWYDDITSETFCLLYEFDGRVTGSHITRSGFTVYENDVLMSHKLFRGYRDYGKYVLYEYELTNKLFDYRNILLEGRYSLLPEEAKKAILDFNLKVYGPNEKEFIQKVLYKDPNLLLELSNKYNVPLQYITEGAGIIDPEKELFSNSIIKQERNEIK